MITPRPTYEALVSTIPLPKRTPRLIRRFREREIHPLRPCKERRDHVRWAKQNSTLTG